MKDLTAVLYAFGVLACACAAEKLSGIGAAMLVLGIGFLLASFVCGLVALTHWATGKTYEDR